MQVRKEIQTISKIKLINKMKKLVFTTAIISLIIFIACDKVKHPNQHPEVYVDCKLVAPIVKTNASTSGYRKVLVEDYTGHTCGNCPPAAVILEDLVKTYPGKVIGIASHVNKDFAAPKTDTYYREDFRDVVSNEWGTFFGTGDGLPTGMVNRELPYRKNPSSWSSVVPDALNKPQVGQLDITTTYDVTQHLLNIKVKTTFKKALTDSVKLLIVLTQDSIIGDQKDYTPPAGTATDPDHPDRRPTYRFDHLLIGSVNGTWGDLIKVAPSLNDTVTTNKSCYLLSKCFYKDVVCVDDKHVSVIAFIYSDATKEILQVDKVKIR